MITNEMKDSNLFIALINIEIIIKKKEGRTSDNKALEKEEKKEDTVC